MVLPVIPHAYLVTQKLIAPDERHEFINRFCVLDPAPPHTPGQVATALAAAYEANLMPVINSIVTMGQTDVLPLDGITPTQSFATASVGSAGGHVSAQQLPYVVCKVITWQTGVRGRRHRGRSYLPGVSGNELVDARANVMNAADAALLTAAGFNFATGLATGAPAFDLQVLSIRGGFITGVANARGNVALGVQRRRYEKVARH